MKNVVEIFLELRNLMRGPAQAAALQLQGISAAALQVGANLRQVGDGALAFGQGVGRALAAPTAGFVRYQAALAEVRTLNNASAADITRMDAAVRELSVRFGSVPVETAKGLYQAMSAGFMDAADAARIMDTSMKLARGGITSTFTAVDGLTSVLNAYGLAASQSGAVSDAMFVAMRAGKTTIDQLASSIGVVAPIAAQMGASVDDVLAATAALTLGGKSTSEAMTGLRGMFNAVVRPTDSARRTADRLGLSFNASAIRARGFAAFLEDVRVKTNGSADVLAQLFGDVEGLGAAMALTGNQAKQFAGILGQMGIKAGSTGAAFNIMANTLDARMQRMKARFSVLAIDIATPIAARLETQVLPALERVSSALQGFARAHPRLVEMATGFAGVAAAVSAVVGVLGLAGASISGMAAGFAAAAKIAAVLLVKPAMALSGALSGIVTLLGGAVLAKLALVGAAVAGIYLGVKSIMDNWRALVFHISAGASELLGSFRRWLDALAGGLRNALPAAFRGAIREVQNVLGTSVDFWRGRADRAASAVSSMTRAHTAAAPMVMGDRRMWEEREMQGLLGAAVPPLQPIRWPRREGPKLQRVAERMREHDGNNVSRIEAVFHVTQNISTMRVNDTDPRAIGRDMADGFSRRISDLRMMGY